MSQFSRWSVCFSMLATAFLGCSRGGGSGDSTAPTVLNSPQAGLAQVSLQQVLEFLFSESMDPATITEGNLVLEDTVGVLESTVEYEEVDDNSGPTPTRLFKGRIVPMDSLSLLSPHVARVTTGTKDRSGNALAQEFSISFQSADGSFRPAMSLARETSDPQRVRFFASNSKGEGFAVWGEFQNPDQTVKSAFFTPQLGWGAEQVLAVVPFAPEFFSYKASGAINENGDAVVLYYDRIDANQNGADGGDFFGVWARIYDKASQMWDSPTLLGNTQSNDLVVFSFLDDFHLGVDESGAVLAVWLAKDTNGIEQLFSNRYLPGQGWEANATILNGETIQTERIGFAMAPNGMALAAWSQEDPTTSSFHIHSSSYDPTSGWGGSTLIGKKAVPGEFEFFPKLAMNAAGDAMVIYNRFDPTLVGPPERTWSNRYLAGSGWQQPERVEDIPFVPRLFEGFEVQLDEQGHAIAAIWKFDFSGEERLLAVRYVAGSGWQAPQTLNAPFDSGSLGGVQLDLKMDRMGNAFLAAPQIDKISARFILWVYRFDANAGDWDAGTRVDDPALGNLGLPINPCCTPPREFSPLGVDAAGNAMIVFAQENAGDPFQHVLANRYLSGQGWQGPQPIDAAAPPIRIWDFPRIVTDRRGRLHVFWSHLDDDSGKFSAQTVEYR